MQVNVSSLCDHHEAEDDGTRIIVKGPWNSEQNTPDRLLLKNNDLILLSWSFLFLGGIFLSVVNFCLILFAKAEAFFTSNTLSLTLVVTRFCHPTSMLPHEEELNEHSNHGSHSLRTVVFKPCITYSQIRTANRMNASAIRNLHCGKSRSS